MISSTEEAILILKKWQSSSRELRMVFGSNHALMTSYGKVQSVDDPSSIWCIGEEMGAEIRFDLAAAGSVAFIDSGGVPEGLEFLSGIIDESISMVWADGTRLNLVAEKPSNQ
ncbi:MAG TPA: hypothetical protein VK738_03965 [Terriglobales bacterium]|jgi:hypothetical protein|nr:hypothetical protein [Terriglobales bacterium]